MKIVVCTLAINPWYYDIVRYALHNIQTYCEKHKYECVIETESTENAVYDAKRTPCWYKIKLIEKILKENTSCDYVVWIDADCQILNHETKLEYFIEKYLENKNIQKNGIAGVVGVDPREIALVQENDAFNTGVMFVKNSEFNIKLMDKIWNSSPELHFKDFHEQSAFANIWKTDDEIKEHVNVIPFGVQDELVVYWGNYYPGKSFLLHSARCAWDKLAFMFMMDQYYPFKMNEENDDEYKYRKEWVDNIDICRTDINKWLNGEHVPRRYSARCKKIFGVGVDPHNPGNSTS